MGKSDKTNGKQQGTKASKKQADEAPPPPARGYLIRIPKRAARLRAVMVLGEVRETYYGFPDYQFLVTPEHVEALRRDNIPFEIL